VWEYSGTGLWMEDPGDKAEWVGGQGGWGILEAGTWGPGCMWGTWK